MKKYPDAEVYLESFTESGKPLFITVEIDFSLDESNDNASGSKPFWTYDIISTRAVYHDRDGGPEDYTDSLDDDHHIEIKAACEKELLSKKAA